MMVVGTLASPPSCRDKGLGVGVLDEGALCLSSWVCDHLMGYHHTPGKSRCDEDKHKAPTLPHIRPLSLQDGGGHLKSLPDLVVKHYQDGGGTFRVIPTFGRQCSSVRGCYLSSILPFFDGIFHPGDSGQLMELRHLG